MNTKANTHAAVGVLVALCLTAALTSSLSARIFTDTDGRTVEAEVAGLRGDQAVLNIKGKLITWPMDRLSQADQDYIREWAEKRPPTKIVIRADGVRTGGTNLDRTSYFELDLYNQQYHDSGPLVLQAIAVTRTSDGRISEHPITMELPKGVEARSAQVLSTREVEAVGTKRRVAISGGCCMAPIRFRTFRTSTKVDGIWVRLYQGPHMVGELKDLTPNAGTVLWTLEHPDYRG